MKNENIEWSLYWAQDRLHSCVAADQDVDQKALNTLWSTFSSGLGAASRILDLATGNGAVPYALLADNKNHRISGVDRADIAPLEHLSDHGALSSVEFIANTDINQLSLEPQTFDALTSQFGIEYAGLQATSLAVLPLLKLGGRLRFLIHHSDSEIVRSSKANLHEMSELIKPDGLIECLLSVLKGKIELKTLEQKAAEHQASDVSLTQKISGQVFSGINQIVAQMSVDPKAAIDLGATLNLRVRSEHARLSQMIGVAQSEESMGDFTATLEHHGMHAVTCCPYYADDVSDQYLLGWLVDAERRT